MSISIAVVLPCLPILNMFLQKLLSKAITILVQCNIRCLALSLKQMLKYSKRQKKLHQTSTAWLLEEDSQVYAVPWSLFHILEWHHWEVRQQQGSAILFISFVLHKWSSFCVFCLESEWVRFTRLANEYGAYYMWTALIQLWLPGNYETAVDYLGI